MSVREWQSMQVRFPGSEDIRRRQAGGKDCSAAAGFVDCCLGGCFIVSNSCATNCNNSLVLLDDDKWSAALG